MVPNKLKIYLEQNRSHINKKSPDYFKSLFLTQKKFNYTMIAEGKYDKLNLIRNFFFVLFTKNIWILFVFRPTLAEEVPLLAHTQGLEK